MHEGNTVLQAIAADRPAFGVAAETRSPIAVETLGAVGFDFVWVDLEHGGPSPLDAPALDELVRAAALAGTELFVRLPSGEPHVIRKALDAGVRTLLVPRVETATEVERAARATRYVYDGEPGDRGIGDGRDTRWGADLAGAVADEEVCLGVMIETAAAVEHLEAICAIPGLDFAFVGPADLSVSLGHPLETDHPEVRAAVSTVETTVAASDVALGGIRNDPEAAAAAIDDGYRVLRVGGQLAAARETLAERLDALSTE
ncbi:HpcH/HpaI aldolase family protein [Halorubrum vacuolatum]|uniref:2,4-dihydroxyhept-2-enedioate aldolase n=1 Tax=Halorubrum vacuolatum TaxID=63740 RepID=A0A238WV82_HALVU|nr:aldolase/citrate lyase family protein [Halorubrum vacuolatum]SNR50457.1 2,4-dihydroxyhept-2-enedioate aldolase [Halorubrum vacuolatum]